MKLLEALNTIKVMRQKKVAVLPCYLASGFTPLYLKTFLTAELCQLFPDRVIEISEGIYGDLCGNLKRFAKSEAEFGAIFVEWADLDPRLGIRSTARWSGSELADILVTAQERTTQLQHRIVEDAQERLVAVSLPTLPLPPFSSTPGWQAGSFEIDLHGIVQSLASAISRCPLVRILNSQCLDLDSPLRDRFDIESESLTGFPYRLSHASALASSVALLLRHVPKKGLITDLDDTLWKGILGEDGVDGISWNLESHSQMHAFYQRFLGSLAGSGVLIGAATKNDPTLVERALHRDDLALSPSVIFPVEAHWQQKSQSVARILATWNLRADSVVFVDDSPLELAEVEAAHPEVQCLRFPTGDSFAIHGLILKLHDLFGKGVISEEDTIRTESIRGPSLRADSSQDPQVADFLDQTKAEMNYEFGKLPLDLRALELVNKTNQFNLNGRRYTEASWLRLITDASGFLMVASYRDKFGPLGKIAVLAGSLTDKKLSVNTWVMSCRAFSRRIEYKCLVELLARFQPAHVEFDYEANDRNGPIRDFLNEVIGGPPSPKCTISREDLDRHLATFINLREAVNG